jgi:hypothetical protein
MFFKYVSFFVCLLSTVSCASSNDAGREVSCSFSQDSDALLEEASFHLSSPKSGSPEVTDSNNESKLSSEKDGNLIFNRIPPDIIRHISTFMEPKDVANWRNVNVLTIFSVPLKKTVEQTFNISGLDEIDDFEPELAYVMELVHTSHDHYRFFTALMEDVVGEKKPYVVLFYPLMLHLLRTLLQLNPRERKCYARNFERRFKATEKIYMAKICMMKGQFDLVFEIARDDAGLAGWALHDAAQSGLAHFVEILIKYRTDISYRFVGQALEYAAKNGHTLIVELLLRNRLDIPTYALGNALSNAAQDGHTLIVELLPQYRPDIPAYAFGVALKCATRYGHTPIVEILLQRRADIPTDDLGGALRDAAKNGRTLIVELLLRYRLDIPTYSVGMALINAAQDGHTLIVEILLQDCPDIPAYAFGVALKYAAHYGHTLIVEILLQRRPDIPADDVGGALFNAAQGERTLIVELLRRHQVNMDC